MNDDFSTPEAIAILFELANDVNRTRSAERAGLLRALAGVLGLLQRNPQSYLQAGATADGLTTQAIEVLIAQRLEARKAKTGLNRPGIRDELAAAGIVLEDGPQGSTGGASSMAQEKYPVTPAIRVLRQHKVDFSHHPYDYEEHGGTAVSSRELGSTNIA